jgi:hypothetical protein
VAIAEVVVGICGWATMHNSQPGVRVAVRGGARFESGLRYRALLSLAGES